MNECVALAVLLPRLRSSFVHIDHLRHLSPHEDQGILEFRSETIAFWSPFHHYKCRIPAQMFVADPDC